MRPLISRGVGGLGPGLSRCEPELTRFGKRRAWTSLPDETRDAEQLERAGEPLEGFRALFVRADLLGGRVRPGRDAAVAGQPASGVVLHVGTARQRGDLPLPAL